MKRCRIVPAIDLINGRCVRLRQGSFDQTEVVGEDPVSVAKTFAQQGFRRLHLVDLDGARAGSPQHLTLVRTIRDATGLSIDFSGGLRSMDDVTRALESGAQHVVIGSAAVVNPEEVLRWISIFGGESIIIGLDVLDGEVRIKGWEEGSSLSLASVIERFNGSDLRRLMSTDISRDGMLQGAAVEMYQALCRDYPRFEIIASGGVSSAEDVQRLAASGVSEIIVGKALYAGTLALSEVQEFLW
jgi:phosphoribosylformimino-5-aminoimidazole carboxamide ribotide isomerase